MLTIEAVQKRAEELYGEELCKYCIYRRDCSGGVKNYGAGPIFPPCSGGDLEEYFDYDAFKDFLESEE